MWSTSRRLYELNILDCAHAEPLWSVRMSTGTQIGGSGHTPWVFVSMCVWVVVRIWHCITLSSAGYHICFPSCFIVGGEKEQEAVFSAEALTKKSFSHSFLCFPCLSSCLISPRLLSCLISPYVLFSTSGLCQNSFLLRPPPPIFSLFCSPAFIFQLLFNFFSFVFDLFVFRPSVVFHLYPTHSSPCISSLSISHFILLSLILSIWLIRKPFKAIDVAYFGEDRLRGLCVSVSLHVSVSGNVNVPVMYIYRISAKLCTHVSGHQESLFTSWGG